MATIITKQDTDGNKGLLSKAEFGYDDYIDGGDEGRVYVGTGSKNIALATKEEVDLALDKEDVLTSLSINANTLKYVDEKGLETVIDLSVYLDDTNLAKLVGGTLDAVSGVATFRRDDDTTFTLDMSALLDDTIVDIEDTLSSTRNDSALSSNQGRVLNERIDALTTITEW